MGPTGGSNAVAIIGAGVSGLTCARELARSDVPVRVFEKSRGVGGRVATQRSELDVQFDHGAQYFTVKDARFARDVGEWLESGSVAIWRGQLGDEDGDAHGKHNQNNRLKFHMGLDSAMDLPFEEDRPR